MTESTCDACGRSVHEALVRTVRLSVDRAEIDSQKLCPDCFADWIARYEQEMQSDADGGDEGDGIIVD